jgi:hypothetical protein
MVKYTLQEAKEARRLRWEKRKAKREDRLIEIHPERMMTCLTGKESYPKINVMSEWKTLEMVLNGCSLSRYGDGEIKHMDGKKNVSQVWYNDLAKSLTDVFHSDLKGHLVGIPNVFNGRSFDGLAEKYIESMQRRFGKKSDPKKEYASAYVTRADLCGYLDWASYWSAISELWAGQDVVLVRGNPKRANPGMMNSARDIINIEVPSKNAWECYPAILKECLRMSSFSRFLLCAGPTATVLAYDLHMRGRHAVDIGHLGMFYGRWVGGLVFTTPKDLDGAL